MKKSLLVILLLALSVASYGQPWNQLIFEVLRPPEISTDTFPTIIISEIINNRNRTDEHTMDIYDELANNIAQIEGLALVDRSKTESLLKEFEFQQSSGLVNDDQIRKLGEFLGSGLIAFGRIQQEDYKDEVLSETSFVSVNGCNTSKYRKATYTLHVNFKFIDLETAKVIHSKTLSSSLYQTSEKLNCKTPPKMNKNDIYLQCVKDIGGKFKNIFASYEEKLQVTFQKHPKFNDQLKEAINYLRINESEKGLAIIAGIPQTQNNKNAKSAALYNLALLQYQYGNYQRSLANAKEAYMLDPKNSDCLNIVNALE